MAGEFTEFPIPYVTYDEANIPATPGGGGGSGASYFMVPCTDRLTPISAASADLSNIQDWMMQSSLSVTMVHASLSQPATTGTFTIDILRNGVSVLSTLLTIDAGESNSTTAAVPAILSDFDWSEGDTITVAVTDDADGTASGLKLYINTGAVAADTESPTDPTGLAATVISATQIDLDCDAAADNVGVVGYQFQRATNSGFSAGVVSAALQASPSVSITGLTGGTTYYFRVRAKDAAGNYSGWSSSVNATTDAAIPLTSGLVSYWKLDESAGSGPFADAIDEVGTNDLVATGTVDDAAGKVGTSRTFTSNAYLGIADNASLSITGNMTVAFWVYPTSGADMAFVSKYNVSGNQRSYSVLRESGVLSFIVSSNGTATTSATTGADLTSNVWTFVVAWYDGTNINIQVNNGTVFSTAYSSGIFNGTSDFSISAIFVPSEIYGVEGRMDEVGIWSRALSADDRTALYNGGAGNTHPF